MKKFISAFLVCCLLFLSGCSVLSLDSEDIMAPPKASGNTAEIEKLINSTYGSDYTLAFPLSGSHRGSILIEDINSDGADEALALYSTTEGTTGLLFAEKKNDGFHVLENVFLETDRIDRVDFSDIDGDQEKEILVGYYTEVSSFKSLSVYNVNGDVTGYDIPAAYSSLSIGNFDNNDSEDVLFLLTATADVSAKAVLMVNKGSTGLAEASSCEIDSNIVSFENVLFGKISSSQKGAVVDGLSASGEYTTQVIYYDPSQKELLNPLFIYSGYSDTTRSAYITSSDINDDDIIEVPVCSELPFSENAAGEAVQCISWDAYDFSAMSLSTVKTSVLDPGGRYMFTLSPNRVGAVTARYDPQNREMDFYVWEYKKSEMAATTKLLSIREYDKAVFETENILETELSSTNTGVYTYRIDDTSSYLSFSEKEVVGSFELI